MQRSKLSVLAILVTVVAGAASQATSAKEYNQRPFLEPGQNSKVQRVITHGRTEKARQEQELKQQGVTTTGSGMNKSIVNTGCGDLSFGNVRTTGRPGERLPRENIVVAKEVINAPINCNTKR